MAGIATLYTAKLHSQSGARTYSQIHHGTIQMDNCELISNATCHFWSVMARENAKQVNNNNNMPLLLLVLLVGSGCLFTWETILSVVAMRKFTILDERNITQNMYTNWLFDWLIGVYITPDS